MIMYPKVATTVHEQIAILKQRGIVISNDEKAQEVLLDIGYFRLGFYCFPFEKEYPKRKNRTHFYIENTEFDDIVKLYYFDYDLRNILKTHLPGSPIPLL